MAILQTLREKAGIFVAGAIGLSLFIFVISDFFGNSNSQRRKQQKYYQLATIGGEFNHLTRILKPRSRT